MRLTIVSVLFLASVSWSQTLPGKPVFEAASIKLDPKADGSDSENSPGLLRAQMTLRHFIMYAYDVKQFQVIGGPNWLDMEHYDIVAKLEKAEDPLPADATPRQRSMADTARIRAALQALLAERFRLTFHHESKEMPAYVLTVAKGGFKLTEAPGDGGSSMNSKGSTARNLTATRASMERLAAFLAREVGGPVSDQTQIQGVYSFTLDWTPDDLKPAASSEQPPLPSIFTAIQERLGLKLEPHKAPVDILVVDSAEKPSEN